MKVLYIGVYKDGTGWGQGAINYILSLDRAGVDVVCRNIKLNSMPYQPPSRILELEKKNYKKYDVVVYNLLPHMVSYDKRFGKNIILYTTETSLMAVNSWAQSINLMDAAIVSNEDSRICSQNSGVKTAIYTLPYADDITKYSQTYPRFSIHPEIDNDFKFYWIGEINKRKNLEVALKAFHLSFDPWEPVQFIIKTTNRSKEQLANFINDVKTQLKIYPTPQHYKQEIIIDQFLSEEQLWSLHQTCDAFVCPSSGEAWSYPTFNALGFKSIVLAPLTQGFVEYLNRDNCLPLETREAPVYGEMETFKDLFTGYESWNEVTIESLVTQMSKAYLESEKYKAKTLDNTTIYQFSHEQVGEKFKQILEEVLS